VEEIGILLRFTQEIGRKFPLERWIGQCQRFGRCFGIPFQHSGFPPLRGASLLLHYFCGISGCTIANKELAILLL
jgi:hypothetical protein